MDFRRLIGLLSIQFFGAFYILNIIFWYANTFKHI